MSHDIPWPRVLVEGGVIVLSILLALAADAAWDRQQDRAAEAELLRSLEAELRLNLAELSEWQRGIEATIATADALHSLTGPQPLPIASTRFDSLLVAAIEWRTFHPATGSMSSARAHLDLVRSDRVRQEVAAFDERLRDFQENFEQAWLSAGTLLRYAQDHAPLYTPDNVGWAHQDASLDRRELLSDVGFSNELGLWLWRLNHTVRESQSLRGHLEQMLRFLQADT
jgi:hypothetical protein